VTSSDPLLASHAWLFGQVRDVLRGLDPDVYRAPAAALGLYPTGAHLRHALDLYDCFLRGLRDGGVVDYEARARDARVEEDPGFALATLDRLERELGEAAAAGWPERVVVLGDRPREEWAVEAVSTPQRELLFLLHHAIHHLALVAVVLRSHGVEVPDGFGVAPSTLRHWEAQTR